ncbi:unnamed protein product, partial [Owenia fusiformis]
KMFIMDEVTLNYIVFCAAMVPIILYGIVGTFFCVSLFYAKFYLHRKGDPSLLLTELPGVSIIKPLMGVDPLLEENLESHFLINYPKYELLLCVQDEQDPVLELIQKLKARYPKVDTTLFIGGEDGIINPMVHNMAPGYNHASYDLIWISTSRIKASTEILLDMVGKIQPAKVAMVHQMPFTTDQKGIAATVEKIYFGCNIARNYLALNVFNVPCVTGMSYLVKKAALDEINGLSYYGKYLAEDFFIAKFLHEKGYILRVAAVPAQQNVASCTVVGYKDRMVRWLRLRLNMMWFVSGVLEPMSEALILGTYGAWAIHHFFGYNPYIVFLIHTSVWIILDYINLRMIENGPLPFNKLQFALGWFIRETLVIFVFFEALTNPWRIKWGKRTYRVSCGGHTEILNDKAILPI